MTDHKQKWMQLAIQAAVENVEGLTGGPFGAVVVKDGAMIAIGKNQVTALHDPTAHAEVQAIRAACAVLGDFQLTDCEIYTSCEPCPMCLGAMYWARPKAVYFAYDHDDAAKAGFDDHFIYEQIALPVAERSIPMIRLTPTGVSPFEIWTQNSSKIAY